MLRRWQDEVRERREVEIEFRRNPNTTTLSICGRSLEANKRFAKRRVAHTNLNFTPVGSARRPQAQRHSTRSRCSLGRISAIRRPFIHPQPFRSPRLATPFCCLLAVTSTFTQLLTQGTAPHHTTLSANNENHSPHSQCQKSKPDLRLPEAGVHTAEDVEALAEAALVVAESQRTARAAMHYSTNHSTTKVNWAK